MKTLTTLMCCITSNFDLYCWRKVRNCFFGFFFLVFSTDSFKTSITSSFSKQINLKWQHGSVLPPDIQSSEQTPHLWPWPRDMCSNKSKLLPLPHQSRVTCCGPDPAPASLYHFQTQSQRGNLIRNGQIMSSTQAPVS